MYFSERALASMSTLFLYLDNNRKTAGLFFHSRPQRTWQGTLTCVCVLILGLWEIELVDGEKFGWRVFYHETLNAPINACFPVTQRRPTSGGLEDVSPSNPGFRPSSHGAVQLQYAALPHSLPTGHDDKLRRVCQAVWVHFLTELCPLVHLQQDSEDRFSC